MAIIELVDRDVAAKKVDVKPKTKEEKKDTKEIKPKIEEKSKNKK